MNNMDKAFIAAYGREAANTDVRMMPLSHAMELSRAGNEREQEQEITSAQKAVVENAADATCDSTEISETPAAASSSEPGELKALLQVDAFTWPKECKKLARIAGSQLQTLADCVAATAESGRNLIGFVGDCDGCGCTTLLLSTAKQLAAEMSVVVVDVNLDNPGVARKLGLLAEVGWKDVAVGRLPLAEAMIDSLDDGLTVLPYAGHQDAQYESSLGGGLADLRLLAMHYDLVLLDLGTLPAVGGNNFLLNCLDAAVIVRAGGTERADDSRRIEQILRSAGVGVVGVAENRCNCSPAEANAACDVA